MNPLPRGPVATPFFIERAGRRLFALHRCPANGATGGCGVVVMPPFAEEMNRSRRMATLLALAYAAQGGHSLVFDLTGTGDSSDDFAAASWDLWLDDAEAAVSWLRERTGHPVAVVGLRLGAFLALAAARQCPGCVDRIVLWQPVTSGKTMLTQFLRIRIAATMAQGTGGETTQELRQRLADGDMLEVAGYDISPGLAGTIDDLSLAGLPPPEIPVHWLDLAAEEGREMSPASRRVIDGWREASAPVSARTVTGEPFWSLQETTVAPALIGATVSLITEAP